MTNDTYETLTSYIQQHNRIPIDDKQYDNLINQLRKEYLNGKPEALEKGNQLTQICGGDFWKKKIDCKNYNTIMSIREFYNKKAEFPAQIRPVNRTRTSDEDIEYKMACWLNGKKHKYKKEPDGKNKEIFRLLDTKLPNWNKKYNPEENAIKNANLVKIFYQTHNRMPKQSNLVDKEEYRLATWCNSQKLSLKGKNTLYNYPSVIDILNQIPDFVY